MAAPRFLNQHIVVTGGNSGIGRAIAHRFAAEGGRVTIAARTERTGLAVVAELEQAGREACFVQTDVADPASITRLVAQATDLLEREKAHDIIELVAPFHLLGNGLDAPQRIRICDVISADDNHDHLRAAKQRVDGVHLQERRHVRRKHVLHFRIHLGGWDATTDRDRDQRKQDDDWPAVPDDQIR